MDFNDTHWILQIRNGSHINFVTFCLRLAWIEQEKNMEESNEDWIGFLHLEIFFWSQLFSNRNLIDSDYNLLTMWSQLVDCEWTQRTLWDFLISHYFLSFFLFSLFSIFLSRMFFLLFVGIFFHGIFWQRNFFLTVFFHPIKYNEHESHNNN